MTGARIVLGASSVFAFAVLWFALSAAARNVQVVSLRVDPAVALAPSGLRVTIRIVPHAENRALFVRAESPDFERASAWTLDGREAPVSYVVEWRALPVGEYEVRAVLYGPVAMRGTARAHVIRQ